METTTYTDRPQRHPLAYAGLSALVATSMTLGVAAGPAFAAPQQGGIGGGNENPAPQQPGVGGEDQGSQQQGGITPAPTPQPQVQPPSSTPGPGGLPAAPSAPQTDWTSQAPSYDGGYDPTPRTIHAPDPAAPKVKRIAPKPKTLRIGNFEMKNKDVPNFPNKEAYIDWANGWAAYSEQQIANTLISMGMAEEDEASRQAAAIVMGAAGAGAIGGAVAFTTTTIAVGVFTVPIGAVTGAVVGSQFAMPGPGALIGAGVGAGIAVGAGAAAGIGGAIVGGLIGGSLGWALGAGDKGDDGPPSALPKLDQHDPDGPAGSGVNQFELHLNKSDAARAGLPAVDYVVTERGDVDVTVGATSVGWTAEQAQAPIKALGAAAPAAERAINDGVVAATDFAADVVDGLQVLWPQESGARDASGEKPARVGAHRKSA